MLYTLYILYILDIQHILHNTVTLLHYRHIYVYICKYVYMCVCVFVYVCKILDRLTQTSENMLLRKVTDPEAR